MHPRPAAADDGSERPAIAVVVIDDHQMVAESILRLLRDEPDMDVVGVATTAHAGLALAAQHRPGVVIMDYLLPDLDGVTAAAQLRAAAPATNIILLTGNGGDDILVAAIQAGCSGYLEKTRAFDELARAVRLAAAGDIVLPPGRLAALLPRLMTSDPPATPVELTRREAEVLAFMGEGLANKSIAGELGLHLNTVRNHVQNLLVKLGAHSKLEAVAIASRRGLLSAPGHAAAAGRRTRAVDAGASPSRPDTFAAPDDVEGFLHDLNNLLAVILNYSLLLGRAGKEPSPELDALQVGARRAVTLVHEFQTRQAPRVRDSG